MKKFLYFLLVAVVFTVAACGTGDEEQTKGELNEKSLSEEHSTEVSNSLSPSLASGLDEVLHALDNLKMVVEGSPDDLAKIQTTGKELEENWDKIEKQVEDKNPEAYINIEKSLYPLITEVKKDNPNVVEITQLIDATTMKVKQFKETLGS